MKKPKIKIAIPSLIIAAALVLSGDTVPLLAVFSSAALHELGHIAAARSLGVRFSEFSLSLLGARLNTETKLISYRSEIILAAAGPSVNLAVFLIFFPQNSLGGAIGEFFSYLTASSLALGFLNLLPITTFDGGRILYSLVSLAKDPETASKLLRSLSFCCLFIMWSMSVYLLIKTGASLSLFVFSLTLFARFFINE